MKQKLFFIFLSVCFANNLVSAQKTDTTNILWNIQNEAMQKKSAEIEAQKAEAVKIRVERETTQSYVANKANLERQVSSVQPQILVKKADLERTFGQIDVVYQRLIQSIDYKVRQGEKELYQKAQVIKGLNLESITLTTTEFTPELPAGFGIEQQQVLIGLQRQYKLLLKQSSTLDGKNKELTSLFTEFQRIEGDYVAALASYTQKVQELSNKKLGYTTSCAEADLRITGLKNRLSALQPEFIEAVSQDVYESQGKGIFEQQLAASWQGISVSEFDCAEEDYPFLQYLSGDKMQNLTQFNTEICALQKEQLAKSKAEKALSDFIGQVTTVISNLKTLNADLDAAKANVDAARGVAPAQLTLYQQATQAFNDKNYIDAQNFANASINQNKDVEKCNELIKQINSLKKKRGIRF